MRGPLEALLGLLFPEKCVCCRAITGGGVLCAACAGKLRRLPAVSRHPRQMGQADAIAAVYAYAGAGGALIRALKFRGRKNAYTPLRPGFEEVTAAFYAGEHISIVVPVPMHRAALRRRGFNHAELIAQGLAEHMRVPCQAGLLEKTHQGRMQHRLPAGERAENVREAYAACGALHGETVLLVDDIVTTGATLGACAQVLKQAGAVRVVCAAVLAAE